MFKFFKCKRKKEKSILESILNEIEALDPESYCKLYDRFIILHDEKKPKWPKSRLDEIIRNAREKVNYISNYTPEQTSRQISREKEIKSTAKEINEIKDKSKTKSRTVEQKLVEEDFWRKMEKILPEKMYADYLKDKGKIKILGKEKSKFYFYRDPDTIMEFNTRQKRIGEVTKEDVVKHTERQNKKIEQVNKEYELIYETNTDKK